MTLSGTITESGLAAEFDAERANLNTSNQTAAKMWQVRVERRDLADTTDVSLRSVDFEADDDYELVVLGIDAFGHASNASTLTVTLEALTSGDDATVNTAPLGEKTVAVSVSTTDDSGDQGRGNYEPSTGEKHFLLKGQTYRLRVTNATASATAPNVKGWALLASRRRRR